ncbi:hypothetical protein NA78x_001763 [Anatilimnocola sp. NA78]|uniref:hypothetical protein n=1 Tax=Anatilimnocola sp. NA78 TaxID=3415683 RepID=UPI003CE45CA5
MAGEWMKIEHATPDKPEVLAIASALNISPDDAFGKCFRMWRWFDKETIAGKAPGIGLAAIDHIVGAKGFAEVTVRVGWLEVITEDGISGLIMPDFEKNCGESAKSRALTARRVARHSAKTNASLTPPALAPPLPRKEKGEREEEQEPNRDRTDRPIGASSDQSPMNGSASGGGNGKPAAAMPSEPRGEPLDLSEVDWDRVVQHAVALAKKVPPFSSADRRQWFKFAVMVEAGMFSEHWLLDAAEAVVNAPQHAKNRQAHLVAVLKSKAAEQGTAAATFRAILRRIEIPVEVWKLSVLKVKS